MLAAPILIPYLTGRMSYYEVSEKGWENGLVTLWDYFSEVLFSWYGMTFQDFLYNRRGPLLNAFLLPWMTFGLAAVLANLRSRLASWTLIWVLLFIFPVPILAHSPFGRVYYPALPAIYTLVAIGMYIFWREKLRAWAARSSRLPPARRSLRWSGFRSSTCTSTSTKWTTATTGA
ncbi:MAG: hypothetical protein HND47_16650 [Chloroflexi bacterium]|nr:hypothetical protein [Chloroflexota bacterium]